MPDFIFFPFIVNVLVSEFYWNASSFFSSAVAILVCFYFRSESIDYFELEFGFGLDLDFAVELFYLVCNLLSAVRWNLSVLDFFGLVDSVFYNFCLLYVRSFI